MMKKIKWPKLFRALRKTFITLFGVITMAAFICFPIVLSLLYNNLWWLLLYVAFFLVGNTWEAYHDKDDLDE